MVDSIIELEDSIKDIKGTYYENFDKLILESKSKLESALKVTKDFTIQALIEEAITKINDCLKRLNIPSQSLSLDQSIKEILLKVSGKIDLCKQFTIMNSDIQESLNHLILHINYAVRDSHPSNEDISSVKSDIEKLKKENTDVNITKYLNEALEILGEESTNKLQRYSKYKYSYPYFKYKKGTQLDEESTEIGKRFANHLMKRSTDPHYDSRNKTNDELNSLIDSLDLKEEEPDPSVTAVIDSALERLKERKLEYLYKKKELVQLSNAKTELSNKKSSLAEFRKMLLDSCILNMIDQAKEE
jgi:polyhydroxyalkanoate synthesis regulator phasin